MTLTGASLRHCCSPQLAQRNPSFCAAPGSFIGEPVIVPTGNPPSGDAIAEAGIGFAQKNRKYHPPQWVDRFKLFIN
jgi:hypothetical protein